MSFFEWIVLTFEYLSRVLSSYYFGNLTHPSKDEPRMGFLSTVPDNAGDLMKAAVAAASNANGNFPGTYSEPLCHRIADSLPLLLF